ncbi:MAG: heparinase II/III family protein [Acidobacteriota bacterium]
MRYPTLFVALGVIFLQTALAFGARNLLSGRWTEPNLARILVSRADLKPYPTIDDRQAWAQVPETIKAGCVKEAERLLGTAWEPLPASLFLEYKRNGNRTNYERVSFGRRQRLATLVMAEVFDNKGRFLDEIANGVWAVCEETFWGVPAHIGVQKKGTDLPDVTEPIVDLFAAETGALLAWTDYLLGPRLKTVSPLLRERIRLEQERRIITPCLDRDDFWWMGFGPRKDVNNWNPWICSNWLTVVLLNDEDEVRRQNSVFKIMRVLDNFLNIYPEDGGCDEGPGYWGRAGASLFDCLELLKTASAGKIDLYQAPLIRRIGQYIYKVYIKDDYYVNFADASARLTPEAGLIYRYGKRINDPVMTGFGVFLARRQGIAQNLKVSRNGSLGRLLPDLFALKELASAPAEEPLLGECWFPDLEVMTARSQPGSSAGLYLAAKGGHNAESHNHNDVGNFIVYADGRPVLIDAGVGTYTSKTFSSRRYEIWTMQSDFHNLPTINGVMQKEGRNFHSRTPRFSADAGKVQFAVDIAGAYPAEAGVERWERTLILNRGKSIELLEDYQLKETVKPVRLNLMTPLAADLSRKGKVVLSDPMAHVQYAISYDASVFDASLEDIPLSDQRLKSAWGERLTRIFLTAKQPAAKGSYKIEIVPED